MGFFAQLFGRKKCRFSPEALDINITEDAFIINGNKIEIPCHIESLTGLLGTPRKTRCSKNSNLNYTWDELGVYCYTKGNNIVNCFAVLARNGELSLKYLPKSTFAGRLSILGKPWEETMSHGVDEEGFARSLQLENFSIFSEYVDFGKGDSEGFEGAYSNAEIQLKDR